MTFSSLKYAALPLQFVQAWLFVVIFARLLFSRLLFARLLFVRLPFSRLLFSRLLFARLLFSRLLFARLLFGGHYIRAANTVSSKINSWSTSCYNHKNSRSLFTLQKLLSHWMSSVLTSMFQCFRCLRTFMCNHRRGRVLLLRLFLSPDIFAINFLFFIYRRCNCLMLLWQWP